MHTPNSTPKGLREQRWGCRGSPFEGQAPQAGRGPGGTRRRVWTSWTRTTSPGSTTGSTTRCPRGNPAALTSAPPTLGPCTVGGGGVERDRYFRDVGGMR